MATLFDPSDVVEVRRIHRKDGPPPVSTWHTAVELTAHADRLAGANAAGWNIHVGANPRKAKGCRSDASVSVARCIFADFDATTPQEARRRWDDSGLPPPSLSVSSGHGAHLYSRLTRSVEDLVAWKDLQWDLAVLLGADVKVRNPERLMRLPGYLNIKGEPVPCRIVEVDATHRVDLDEVRRIVPARPTKVRPPIRFEGTCSAGATRDRLRRCLAYLAKCPDAISGNGGHDATYRAACECYRFGLTDAEAWNLLEQFNSSRTGGEPWNERELAHKLEDAREEVSAAGEFAFRLSEPSPTRQRPRTFTFTATYSPRTGKEARRAA